MASISLSSFAPTANTGGRFHLSAQREATPPRPQPATATPRVRSSAVIVTPTDKLNKVYFVSHEIKGDSCEDPVGSCSDQDCIFSFFRECTREVHSSPPHLARVCRLPSGLVNEPAEERRGRRLRKLLPTSVSDGSDNLPRVMDTLASYDLPSHPTWSASMSSTLVSLAASPARASSQFSTPFVHDLWERHLVDHSDRFAVHLLLDTIRNGANVGYFGPRGARKPVPNHPLSEEQMLFVLDRIRKDIALKRTAGFSPSPVLPFGRSSPVGIAPKRNEAGVQTGWRLICDASSPRGSSLNDFISKIGMVPLSWEQTVRTILSGGPSCRFSVFDVNAAFRHVMVRLVDQPLLGITVDGLFACDLTLSFGVRTSPPIWARFPRMFMWIVRRNGIIIECFVDDFLLVHPASLSLPDTMSQYTWVLAKAAELGFSISKDKGTPPTHKGVYTGVLFDTVAGTVSIPEFRIKALCTIIIAILSAGVASVRDMESLAGKLQFASRAMPPGRVFIRGLYEALAQRASSPPSDQIPLSSTVRCDLEWWHKFLPIWDGSIMLNQSAWSPDQHDIVVTTDASTSWGWSMVWDKQWCARQWTTAEREAATRSKRMSTTHLELIPIVYAALTWGHLWRGLRVSFVTDCMPVRDILNRCDSPNTRTSATLRVLANHAVVNKWDWKASWISTSDNTCADQLSRGGVQDIHQQFAHLNSLPTQTSADPCQSARFWL
jgi:hypothetical protein